MQQLTEKLTIKGAEITFDVVWSFMVLNVQYLYDICNNVVPDKLFETIF